MLTGIGIVTRIDQSATISWQNRPIKFGQADDAMKLWEKAKVINFMACMHRNI